MHVPTDEGYVRTVAHRGMPARELTGKMEADAMLDLGGSFQTFMSSLFGFLNEFLTAVFGGLAGFFNGLNVF